MEYHSNPWVMARKVYRRSLFQSNPRQLRLRPSRRCMRTFQRSSPALHSPSARRLPARAAPPHRARPRCSIRSPCTFKRSLNTLRGTSNFPYTSTLIHWHRPQGRQDKKKKKKNMTEGYTNHLIRNLWNDRKWLFHTVELNILFTYSSICVWHICREFRLPHIIKGQESYWKMHNGLWKWKCEHKRKEFIKQDYKDNHSPCRLDHFTCN